VDLEKYYRALGVVQTPTERYVANLHRSFDWVTDIHEATPDYLESAEATQADLKQQHNIDTELVKIGDPKQMQPKYVLLCRTTKGS
jgi:hypothetical protein